MIGTHEDTKVTSLYQPSLEVRDFTAKVQQDYEAGDNNLRTPFAEFNDMSFLERQDADQKLFNSYVAPKSTNPDERWRFQGTKPITRNKILSIGAHSTAQVLYPNIFAQDNNDEEDTQSASVMKDLILWNIENSDYEISFLFGVFGALVNPVAYFKTEYAQVLQTIKERSENGDLTRKEILDETLSGFNLHNIPGEEILLPDVYQYELQKQRAIIHKRFVEKEEVAARFGKHENFDFVQQGIRTFYNADDATFYDQKDEGLATLVEEVTYYNRREDTEATFINGIYMGDSNVDDNPIKHRDNRNAPKYEYVKFGYEPIDEKKFAYYKSAVNKLSHEQALVDQMYKMTMDGVFLSIFPPVAQSGDGKVDSAVIYPGKVTQVERDSRLEPMNFGSNVVNGFNAIQVIEQSMSQSSQDDLRSGIPTAEAKTAFEIARVEQNARIQLGVWGKILGRAVEDVGKLMIDIILQHQTVAEFDELISEQRNFKYKSFLLSDQTLDGKKVSKDIRFTDMFMGRMMSEEDIKEEEFKLIDREGGLDSKKRLYLVNPHLFSKLKFKVRIDPDTLLPKNETFEKALKLEAFDRMIQSPFADQESVTRDFLFEAFARGDSDKYMQKASEVMGQQLQQQGQGEGQPQSSELVSQMTGNNSLSSLVRA